MDFSDHGCANDKSHSAGVEQDDEDGCKNAGYPERHKLQEPELDGDGDKAGCKNSSFDVQEAGKDRNKESLGNLNQNDTKDELNEESADDSIINHTNMGNLEEIQSAKLVHHNKRRFLFQRGAKEHTFSSMCDSNIVLKSSCGGYVVLPKRPRLKELLQLPEDDGPTSRNASALNPRKIEVSECEEKTNLKKLKAMPKQSNLEEGIFHNEKGLSLRSLFKLRSRDKKTDRPGKKNKIEEIYAKVTELCKKKQTPLDEKKKAEVERYIADAYGKSNLKAQLDSKRKKSRFSMKQYWTKFSSFSFTVFSNIRSKNRTPSSKAAVDDYFLLSKID